jgi:addiction module RelB/DinJ family antitoxin
MAKNANLYIRVNQNTKNQAEQIFSSFGITVSDAVNIFLNKSIMVGGLPFDMITSITTDSTINNYTDNQTAKKPRSELRGCLKIVHMADDFDEPLEEMRDYM